MVVESLAIPGIKSQFFVNTLIFYVILVQKVIFRVHRFFKISELNCVIFFVIFIFYPHVLLDSTMKSSFWFSLIEIYEYIST